MSFASQTKAELCRVPLARRCCAQAEAYGVLLFCNSFTHREVRIITERPSRRRTSFCWVRAASTPA